MAQLERLAREKEEGVISGLREATDRLKTELDQARAQLKITKTELTHVEVCKFRKQTILCAHFSYKYSIHVPNFTA